LCLLVHITELESEETFRKLQTQTPSPSEYPERAIKHIVSPLLCLLVDIIGTDWARIIDTGLKNPDGQDVARVLVEMIGGFPRYDLESDEGIYKAIKDMETKLGQIAHFEEPM
jgi:hypothetical protein